MTRLILGVLALALLSGCGIKGDLQRPGPMWGDAPAADNAEDDPRARQSSNPRVQAPPAPAPSPALPGGPPPGPAPTNVQ